MRGFSSLFLPSLTIVNEITPVLAPGVRAALSPEGKAVSYLAATTSEVRQSHRLCPIKRGTSPLIEGISLFSLTPLLILHRYS
jgi:hypothetical protein